MSITIYYLRRFGLSFLLANTLANDEIEFLDLFLENNSKLLNLYSNRKIEKLKALFKNSLNNLSKNTDIFDEIFMVECLGKKIGQSKIYDKAHSISEFIQLLEIVDWQSEGLLSVSEKLKDQLDEYSRVLKQVEHQFEIDKWKNFVYFLKNTYIKENQIESEGLDRKVLEYLITDGYLEFDQSGSYIMIAIDNMSFKNDLIELFCLNQEFYRNHKINTDENENKLITLDDYLSQDFANKNYLLLRIQGKTLQEIGEIHGVSKERARQKINKIISKMPEIHEIEEFRDIYSKYRISKDIFVNVFHSDERVYEILSLLYKKGNQDIVSYILEGDFSDDVKQFIVATSGKYLHKGEKKQLTREFVIIDILYRNKDLQKYFSLDDIYYLYMEEVSRYPKLKIKSSRSLASLLDRYSKIIFSLKDGYRFHDLDYNSDIRDELIEVFNSIPDGAYNMNWVFNNNVGLMNELDIINGSELHFFCKKYDIYSDDMNLGRNPEFVKGELTKREYVLSELKEFNGRSVDVFIRYMNENFGLNIDSFTSYLFSEFTSNIHNRTIFFKEDNQSNQLASLKILLTEELYEKNEFYGIVSQTFSPSMISKQLIFELGYVEKGNIVISKNYRSAYSALEKYILSNEIFTVENRALFKTNEYFNVIQKLEKNLNILKVSDTSYINIEHFEQKGFDKNRFLQFISRVNDFTHEGEYFSIISLINNGFSDRLLEDGFELISLDRLISVSDKVKAVSVGFPNIYCRSEVKRNLNDFLIDELLKCGSANVENFTNDLNSKYGLSLDGYNVRTRLIDMGAYYSNVSNKIYILKEDYLNEAYDD